MNEPEKKDGWVAVGSYKMYCNKKKKHVWHDILVLDISEEIKKKIFPVVCIFKLKCTKCDNDVTIGVGFNDGTSTYRKNMGKLTKKMLNMSMDEFETMVNK